MQNGAVRFNRGRAKTLVPAKTATYFQNRDFGMLGGQYKLRPNLRPNVSSTMTIHLLSGLLVRLAHTGTLCRQVNAWRVGSRITGRCGNIGGADAAYSCLGWVHTNTPT